MMSWVYSFILVKWNVSLLTLCTIIFVCLSEGQESKSEKLCSEKLKTCFIDNPLGFVSLLLYKKSPYLNYWTIFT